MIFKECSDFINAYNNGNVVIKSGSLRFFGDWFGRPMDNYHTVINVIYNDGILEFTLTKRYYKFITLMKLNMILPYLS